RAEKWAPGKSIGNSAANPGDYATEYLRCPAEHFRRPAEHLRPAADVHFFPDPDGGNESRIRSSFCPHRSDPARSYGDLARAHSDSGAASRSGPRQNRLQERTIERMARDA